MQQHLRMGRYTTTAILLFARPAQAFWNCFPFWQGGPCTEYLLIVGTLAATLGSFGAQRRCDAGGPDADEPPVVSAAKDTA